MIARAACTRNRCTMNADPDMYPGLLIMEIFKIMEINYLRLILINVCDFNMHFIFVQSIFIICPKLFKVLVSF